MGGVCSIAQDPRNPYNIGNSVGNMIHALINIIIAKLAHRSIDSQAVQDYIKELSESKSKNMLTLL
jgi:hypothetical protein